MPLVGQKKQIQSDSNRVKTKIQKVLPHMKVSDSLAQVFSEGDFSLKTKNDKEKAKQSVSNTIQTKFGLKIKEASLEEILSSLTDDSIALEIIEARIEDFENMLAAQSADHRPKIEYAIENQKLIGVRITVKGNSDLCLMCVIIDDETVWLPVTIKLEADGEITQDDCLKINSFLQSELYGTYPHQYSVVVTGPRGGTLSIGRIFTTKIKEEGQEVIKTLENGCVIKY